MALTLQDIEQLFLERGHRSYDGESVSHLRHALQTAALAERHHAGPELITACLLHDLGHLIADRPGTPSCAAWTTSTSTSCCPSCAACSARACWSRSGCTSRPSATSAIWSPTMKRRSRRTRSAAWRCWGQLRCGPGAGFRQPAGRAGCDSAETLGRHGQGAGADHALAGALPGDRRERVDAGEAGGDPLENRACLAPGSASTLCKTGRTQQKARASPWLFSSCRPAGPAPRPQATAPVATGRDGSLHHSLHEPGYRREPDRPAISMDSRLWQAVMPEPH